jgi:penicillin V acylase-like amidase (Ntn superfamily)
MTKRFAAGILGLFVFLLGADATACTTVCFTDAATPVVAYNYDFYARDGLVLVNPRGLTKTSIVRGNPHTWTARFGSLTFNQFGRDLPMTGINERGLVVSQMWLDEGKYPVVDARPEVNPLEWIQLQLDTAASVDDVLKTAREVRIRSGPALHFLTADRAGNAAVIEFLDGELRTRTGADLPIPALTNSTYADSLAYLARHKGFGGDDPLPIVPAPGITSLARFVVAAAGRATTTDGDPIARAFGTLERARQSSSTQWNIVYELGPLRAHFRTGAHAAIRRVDLAAFDLACTRPARMLDIDASLDGDVTARFTTYTTAANLDLVMRSFRKTPFLANTPEEQIRSLARQPDRARCAAGTPVVTDDERLTRGR